MAIKDVVVVLDASSRTVGPYAASLASLFGAHLTATMLVHDPTASVAWPEASVPLLTSVLESSREEARRVLEAFATTAQGLGVAVETEPVEVTLGLPGRALGPLARHFDLAVIEQPNPDAPGDREIMVESVLFESGRPALIVPYVPIAPFRLETVLVAWDGSATAARALGDAMPFLERAKRVEILIIADEPSETEASGQRIVHHLERHGIDAQLHRLPSAGDVASTLLSHAFDAQADLMVMGGYGHSRVREFILGGATRGILEAMTLPVLMAH
jgi:nucleotide-binding universal stress UspA family protein